MLGGTFLSRNIDRSSKGIKSEFSFFRLLSLLAMPVQPSNLKVIDNGDFVLVSDVFELLRNCLINVGQTSMFESDLA